MVDRWLNKCRKYIIRNIYNTAAFSITIFFAIIFSLFSILQYYSLGTTAYDLGINAQDLWSFIHTGSFYTSLLQENLLVEHFTIFKFLQVPLYCLFPSPVTLMLFEDIFISMAGYIVYLISFTILGNRIKSQKQLFIISLLFLISYEMSPYVQSLVSFPFHNMAFLPFFLLLAFYSFLTSKRYLQIISIIFILSIHANFVYIVSMLLVYELFYLHTYNGKKIKLWLYKSTKPGGIRDFTVMILFIALLYGYLVIAGMIKLHLSGITSYSLMPSTGESGTPATSPGALLSLIFLRPSKFLKILSVNGWMKVFYINFMFESVGYISLMSPLSLILDLPYVLYAMPSTYTSYYQLGYQYSALIIGALYISTIIGFYNILRLYDYLKQRFKTDLSVKVIKWFTDKNGDKKIINICLVIILAVVVVMLPYGLLSPPQIQQFPGGSEMGDIFGEHISGVPEYLDTVSNHMPQSSYILTENSLMPYFSNHLHIYASPYTPDYYKNISEFQYIVIQNNSYWARSGGNVSLQNIVNNVLENGSFSIISKYNPGNILVLENKNSRYN